MKLNNTTNKIDNFTGYVSNHYEKAMNQVGLQMTYNDDLHQYAEVKTNIKYTSVTQLLHKFKKPYDKEYWSAFKALEVLISNLYGFNIWSNVKRQLAECRKNEENKDYNEDGLLLIQQYANKYDIVSSFYKEQESIKNQWLLKNKKALEKGSNYHNQKEEQAYINGYDSINNMQMPTITNYTYDLFKLEDGFYSELLVYNNYYKIAGRVDKLIIKTEQDKRYIYIDDYKTNEKIKKTNSFQRFKNPISHIEDCNWNEYKLQLSLYAVLLELAGFETRSLQITHVTPYAEYPEPFEILRTEAIQLLDYQLINF